MAETLDPARRRAAAYWLALAFHMKGESRAARNALVLTAHRVCGLDLLDLVRLSSDELPEKLRPFAPTFERFIAEEGRVSAQAFVVDRLAESGITVVPITDPRYPAHLAQRVKPAQAPTVLLVAGNVELLRETGIAVSGSRNAGDDGLRFARAMGEAIARSGSVLVSGLARGVDREALEGAVDSGGRAIGVAAEGILNVRACKSPEVAEGRLVVVSEFDPTQRWMPGLAMARNSTIAGLSHALVVADCVAPGGTMDQVETHRRLEMPVYVRRGRGEGPLVAEIARRPGITSIQWDGGPVVVPALLGTSAPWATCEIRATPDAIDVHVRAAPTASLEDVIDTIRSEWTATRTSAPAPGTDGELAGRVSEGPPADTTPPKTDAPAPTREDPRPADPVLELLRSRPNDALSSKEIVAATALTKGKVDHRLRSLVEAGDVTVTASGRKRTFRLAVARQGDDAADRVAQLAEPKARDVGVARRKEGAPQPSSAAPGASRNDKPRGRSKNPQPTLFSTEA